MSSNSYLKRKSNELENSIQKHKKSKVKFAIQRENEVVDFSNQDPSLANGEEAAYSLTNEEFEEAEDVVDLYVRYRIDRLEELTDDQLLYGLIVLVDPFYQRKVKEQKEVQQELKNFSKEFNFEYSDEDFENYERKDLQAKNLKYKFVVVPAEDE